MHLTNLLFLAQSSSFTSPEPQCNIEGSSKQIKATSIDIQEEPYEEEIDNILTDLSDLFANRKAVGGQDSKTAKREIISSENVDKENHYPRGVQNVMLGQPLETWEDLNYFYSLQWKGQYYNSTHSRPEFGTFLEDTNCIEEDQDELDSLGLIQASVEKSQEGSSSSSIQFEPQLTSTTALPPISTSKLTLNNDITMELVTQESKEMEEMTASNQPNQPPSPASPSVPETSAYELRSSRQNSKCRFTSSSSRGQGRRGRGRGRGRGQKRSHDMMTYSAPSPADSVSSSGSGGGEMNSYNQGEPEGGRNWL